MARAIQLGMTERAERSAAHSSGGSLVCSAFSAEGARSGPNHESARIALPDSRAPRTICHRLPRLISTVRLPS